MRALCAAELLQVWDRGLAQPPVERALALLAAACPEASAETLAHFSIGRRDALLLTLREWTFGPQLTGQVVCTECGAALDVNLAAETLRSAADADADAAEISSLRVGGFDISFRLPTSQDLIALGGEADLEIARRQMLRLCVLHASHEGKEQSAEEMPAHVVAEVINRMAQADPAADLRMAIACPACGHRWQAAFDIMSFFWSEIHAWAVRALHDVHALASAYGWREHEILALSPWRRQFYADLVSR